MDLSFLILIGLNLLMRRGLWPGEGGIWMVRVVLLFGFGSGEWVREEMRVCLGAFWRGWRLRCGDGWKICHCCEACRLFFGSQGTHIWIIMVITLIEGGFITSLRVRVGSIFLSLNPMLLFSRKLLFLHSTLVFTNATIFHIFQEFHSYQLSKTL